ncbi:glutaminase A [Streptacidiphilus jiangxiensis]|uniref:Glutaminase n=1 Tax=Streptacidiphilus jiangxiensis TaxID=235985 RepID=A0A1H7WDL3_STRJI|nr:glutaminase A [Streptacidiphilus jiangxiensis]SEM19682.1 L-glutaminase [Streptacidiphilus jiangxiensis]
MTSGATGAVPDVISEALADLRDRLAADQAGEVARYIPPLALADPAAFGLALVSREGHCYRAGESDVRFTIQSVSKPFVFALALTDLGLEETTRWVGAEPSGEAFNAISLEPGTGRPANPMINAGAIATTGLIRAADNEERFDRILDVLGRFAGRSLDVDETVHRAEAATGDRNRALAHLLRASGRLRLDPAEAADVYFRQCSVLVDTVDLAVMAATLADGGRNPVTGEQVVPEPVAVQVLSVMATCGMYDASGDWMLRVGLPAKSGVSGGLLAVSPGRFGVACYSPPLDAVGSPVRAVAALRELSARFGLHLLHNPAPSAPPVTVVRRDPRTGGPVVTAQGSLDFTAAERLVHTLWHCLPAGGAEPIVLDLERVSTVDGAAVAVVSATLERIEAAGRPIRLVGRAGRAFGRRDSESKWS